MRFKSRIITISGHTSHIKILNKALKHHYKINTFTVGDNLLNWRKRYTQGVYSISEIPVTATAPLLDCWIGDDDMEPDYLESGPFQDFRINDINCCVANSHTNKRISKQLASALNCLTNVIYNERAEWNGIPFVLPKYLVDLTNFSKYTTSSSSFLQKALYTLCTELDNSRCTLLINKADADMLSFAINNQKHRVNTKDIGLNFAI